MKDNPTLLYTPTCTLPLHCVDNGRQEKAGPPDSAVMALYSRISLFVLVGSAKVKASRRGQAGSSPTLMHHQPLTHSLLADYSHI